MWLDGFSSLMAAKDVLALLMTGFAVKALDDWIDRGYLEVGRQDRQSGAEADLNDLLGSALPAYLALSLCLAVTLNWRWAASIFLACYGLGMSGRLTQRFASGLSGLVEIILVAVWGVLTLGWLEMGGAAAFVASAQLLDDWRDANPDRRSGNPNLLLRWGTAPFVLVSVMVTALALYIDAAKSLTGYTALLLLWLILRLLVAAGPDADSRASSDGSVGRSWVE